ncbi:MAG: hypothetical protein IT376_10640 [Polyangiaceae bacterium]|nr:hypothetical protein [Polyangiaceae bacterium]
MNAAQKPPGSPRRILGLLVVCALIALAAFGKHLFATSAPPLARAVELLEKDPNVIGVVGSPASISLAMTRRLRRDVLPALSGQDAVSVLSTVQGPKGEASFRLEARNVQRQGWAGTFAVEASRRSVLKDGKYVDEGASVVVEGDFAPDGTPRIKRP